MTNSYQTQKFAAARSALMLPHPNGEAESIAIAFHEIHHALHQFDRSRVNDGSAIKWLDVVDALMDATGIVDPDGQGLALLKARRLTTEEKFGLSKAVDELAHWFQRESNE